MVIKTERLELRLISVDYIDDIMVSLTDEVTTYMTFNAPKDINEEKRIINLFVSQREKDTDYIFAIVLKKNNEFIGMCGLHNLISGTPELGIWTKVSAFGNHYGREAIGGLIEYAKKSGYKKLIYPVDERNVPSRKIPEFFGGKIVENKTVTENGKTLFEVIYKIEL